ncbi:DUF2059 domain-containing protein [Aquabacter cavernae]|uniref:DUF2059 domain-containing protein n=1 Tax=Aquabacter cavernae TaxID=2496029 RepID=UPI000F8C39C5|nr:DUF2059 domain-containing protein [Aquabacter cavernae]
MRRSTATRLGLGALFLALSLGTAAAQTAAPAAAPSAAQAPSASAMQVARELVQSNGEAAAFNGVLQNLLDGAALGFLQTNPDLAPQLREAAIALRPEFDKRQSEIVDILATAYAEHFSEDELKQALTFYKSAVGKKLVTDRPAIVQQAVQNIQQWGARVNGEAMERIRAEMKKKGYDL